MADIDQPPPSDGDVQNLLDMHWREAMVSARTGMESLRALWPELATQLNESAQRKVHAALEAFEEAYRSLHEAGSAVIGVDAYDGYVQAQAQRKILDHS